MTDMAKILDAMRPGLALMELFDGNNLFHEIRVIRQQSCRRQPLYQLTPNLPASPKIALWSVQIDL
jgi:hypothetical protein